MSAIGNVLAYSSIHEVVIGANLKKMTEADYTGFPGAPDNCYLGEYQDLIVTMSEDEIQLMDTEGNFESFSITQV